MIYPSRYISCLYLRNCDVFIFNPFEKSNKDFKKFQFVFDQTRAIHWNENEASSCVKYLRIENRDIVMQFWLLLEKMYSTQ